MSTVAQLREDALLANQAKIAQIVGKNDEGRLERNLASESKVTGRLPGWLQNEIPHTSPIVWFGLGGRPFDHIFDEMREKDPDLMGFDLRMRTSILALPREVAPADESDGAMEAVELCRKQIEMLSGVGDNNAGGNQWLMFIYSMLENVWSGTAFVEANWGDDFFIHEMIKRPMHHFGFEETLDGGVVLRLRRPGGLVEIPPGKIVFARNSMARYPWGDPLATYMYLVWKAKLYNWLDWSFWLERWAKAVVDIKYKSPVQSGVKESTNEEDPEVDAREIKMTQSARGIHGNGYFVHSDESELTLKNTNVSGGDQYMQYYLMTARMQARMLMNETTTPGLEAGPGSFKKSEITNELSAARHKFFAPSVSAIVESVFRWLVQTHIPGAPVPKYKVLALTSESYARLFKGIESALEAGFGVPEGHLKDIWGIREANPQEALFQLANGAPQGGREVKEETA